MFLCKNAVLTIRWSRELWRGSLFLKISATPGIFLVYFQSWKMGHPQHLYCFIFSLQKWAIHGIFLVYFQSWKMGYPRHLFGWFSVFKNGLSQHLFGLYSVLKNGLFPASLWFIFVFQTNITIVNKKSMWKISIQYMVPGIKPTPFRARVFSQNP